MVMAIIFIIIYFIGFGVMVYRTGLPLGWRIGPILVWAVVVGLWPIFLPISIIIELRHRQ